MKISATLKKKYDELPTTEVKAIRAAFMREFGRSTEIMRRYLVNDPQPGPDIGGWLVQIITERWSACFEVED